MANRKVEKRRRVVRLGDYRCEVCGKQFDILTGNVEMYVYKRKRKGGRMDYFCSYKCMRAYDREKEGADGRVGECYSEEDN